MVDNSIKQCVLMQHGLNLRGSQIGTCCYNMQPPQSGQGYAIHPQHCHTCIDQEDHGIFSYRQGSNLKYGFDHASNVILTLDVTPNINCNLSCSICNEYSSSTWSKFKGIKIDHSTNTSYKIFNQMLDAVDLSGLQEINFSGGEPWLNNNIQRYLEPLSDQVDFSQIVLRFSTNGTQPLTSKLAKFFAKFKLVQARFSLDDIGAWHEYQRYPSNWLEWESNWKMCLETFSSNVMPSINRTISILNIARLSNLDQWHGSDYTSSSGGDPIELIDHLAFGPYSLDYITPGLKKYVLKNQGLQSRAWDYVKNRNTQHNAKKILDHIQQQDQQRNTCLSDVDPELVSVLQQ
jgi:hypothetical protein